MAGTLTDLCGVVGRTTSLWMYRCSSDMSSRGRRPDRLVYRRAGGEGPGQSPLLVGRWLRGEAAGE